MRKALYYAIFAVLVVGCGDNLRAPGEDDDVPGDDAGDDTPDAAEPGPDAFFCAPNAEDELGGTCDPTLATACGGAAAGGNCLAGPLDVSVFPPEGYCVQSDFSDTFCDADADCGEGGVCAAVEFSFGTAAVCLPACCSFDTCPTGQECWDTLNGLPMDKTACVPGDADAADGDTCAGFYECNEVSQCANDFENPGGSCETFGCTPGSAAGCHGGDLCITDDEEPPYTTTICVNSCDNDSDCRQAEGYVCFDPNGLVADDEYCRHPHVGDACTDSNDCGGGTWECLTAGDGFPGGYCTQTGCPTPGSTAGCTGGSICHDNGDENICVDRCPTLGSILDCSLGYTCADTNPAGGPQAEAGGCVPL